MCNCNLAILTWGVIRYLAIGLFSGVVGVYLIPLRGNFEDRSVGYVRFKYRLFWKTVFGWPLLFLWGIFGDILYPFILRILYLYQDYSVKKPTSIY